MGSSVGRSDRKPTDTGADPPSGLGRSNKTRPRMPPRSAREGDSRNMVKALTAGGMSKPTVREGKRCQPSAQILRRRCARWWSEPVEPARAGGDQRRPDRAGRHLGRVDRPAHRHPPAPHRRCGRDHLGPRRPGRPGRPRRCRPDRRRHRPRDLRDLDPRPHLPGHRDPDPGGARHPSRGGLRPAGGLRRLRVRGLHRRQVPDHRLGPPGPGDRRETFSRIVDWEDRTTCVLFGDGAGAVVLEARADAGDRGVLCASLRSDGRHRTSSTSMAGRAPPAPPGGYAWRGARCSGSRSGRSPT